MATATTEQASKRLPGVALCLLCLLLAAAQWVEATTVNVPIQLDHLLLRQLLVRQLFNTPDQSTEILNDPAGCSRIVLASPRLGAKGSDLEIVTEVRARLGVGTPGGCTTLLQWQGSAGFLGRPDIEAGARSLRIEPIDSWLVAADGSRITSGRVWNLAKDRLRPLFSRFRLDLAPSVDGLSRMLPDVLAHRSSQQLQTIIRSLRLGDIQVFPQSLKVSLSFDVEEIAERPQPEPVLSARELQQWETRWQMMDALFTFAVKYYASVTGVQELRSALLDILLDSRYRLRDALTVPATRSDDAVRHWFVDSWQRLSPEIRRIGQEQAGAEPLLWISLLTATDALYALDRLGPAIGLDISADGLRRLARLINEEPDGDPLRYNETVDPELQRLFELPPPSESRLPLGMRFELRPIRSAWAEPSSTRLDGWAPSKDQLSEYLPLVGSLLQDAADKTLKKNPLDPPVAKLFQALVLATAWQESCWRQYVENNKKIEPLRSGTGDVGLMQVNEKVWRGFYDIPKLRWDIAYNGRAGTEILSNYLVRHALKQREHERAGGLDNLARASYSAYNGGPSQISRYRKSDVASSHKKVDAAFWKKYQQVKAGNERNVAQCMGGELADSAPTRPTAKAVKPRVGGAGEKAAPAASTAVAPDTGQRWVLGQKPDHFTLQLAVFSKRESARKFIAQQSLTGEVVIFPVRKGQGHQFVVLQGSYAKRSTADRAKQRLKALKPWVRQFGELQNAGSS